MTSTIELEYRTTMGIFDLDVTLKGAGDDRAQFIEPEIDSIKCEGDIADLLIAASYDRAIVQDILEKAWEKDRRTV
jgi:hypothetical protein